jgi:hypothetical protein
MAIRHRRTGDCFSVVDRGGLERRLDSVYLFPKVEGDTLTCSVTMPAGTSVKRTEQVVKGLEDAARETIQEAERNGPRVVNLCWNT